MKTPITPVRWLCRRQLVVAAALALPFTNGCQAPSFMSAGKDAKPSPVKTASATKAGLPKPNNVSSPNAALSLTSADEHLRLGDQALERGNFQDAQMHFDHVVQKHPDHVKAHHRLGVLADKLGQFPQAEQHYLTALNGDPRNPALLSDLGYSYFMQGRYSDSERYLLQARRSDPNYDKAAANLGLLYASTGREQEALAVLRQLGDDTQVHSLMQQIASGQFAQAQQLASNSFAGQPGDPLTTHTTVQPANPVAPQEMNDATREFMNQLQQARDELRRAEEQYATHQQTAVQPQPHGGQPPQPAYSHPPAYAPYGSQNSVPPTMGDWSQHAAAQQAPQYRGVPQYAGVTPFANPATSAGHPAAHRGNAPENYLADMVAAIDRQPRTMTHGAPLVIGRTDGAGSQSAWSADQSSATAMRDGRPNGQMQPVPIYTGSSGTVNPAAAQFTQQFAGGPSQTSQSPSQSAPWSQYPQDSTQSPMSPAPSSLTSQAPYGETSASGSYSQTLDSQRSTQPPPSAWAQQFASYTDQRSMNPAAPLPGAVQPAAGQLPPGGQRPVEYAHHTQQPGQPGNIALTGQAAEQTPTDASPNWNGYAASPSAVSDGSSAPPSADSYERARREAAILGLGAGPGQVFPYVQQTQRYLPGSDSRLNGAQYPPPVRHMPTGLIPPDLSQAYANPHPHPHPPQQAPAYNNYGQPLPHSQAPLHHPSDYGAAASAAFTQQQQQQQHQYQPQPPPQASSLPQFAAPPGTDLYQTARVQQSEELNGLVNRTWGQSPQSPGYGVTPPSTVQHYGTATSFTPSQEQQIAPYRRQTTDASAAAGATQTSYEAAPGYGSIPHATGGDGIVIPEPYRPTQTSDSHGQMPSIHGQSATGNSSPTSSYAAPMIVPGRR